MKVFSEEQERELLSTNWKKVGDSFEYINPGTRRRFVLSRYKNLWCFTVYISNVTWWDSYFETSEDAILVAQRDKNAYFVLG